MITSSFTGHRPNKLTYFGGYDTNNIKYDPLKNEIRNALIDFKVEKAISGMALGIDQIAAEICVELGIPFTAAVPFIGQENAWPELSRIKYRELLAKAVEVVVVSEGGYAASKMQVRNQYMCDHCDLLIAVWDGTPGGTGNCVKYAQKIERQIVYINPTLLSV